jgi:hypothetical protein
VNLLRKSGSFATGSVLLENKFPANSRQIFPFLDSHGKAALAPPANLFIRPPDGASKRGRLTPFAEGFILDSLRNGNHLSPPGLQLLLLHAAGVLLDRIASFDY